MKCKNAAFKLLQQQAIYLEGVEMRTILLLSMLFIFSDASARAVNKCQVDGNTVYQEAPCKTGAVTTKLSINAKDPSEEEKIARKNIIDSELSSNSDNQRLREIDREIRNLEADIRSYQAKMKSEIALLKLTKNTSANNLAGATYDASLSSEMSAVTSKYQVEIKVAQDSLVVLREEQISLKKDMRNRKQNTKKEDE